MKPAEYHCTLSTRATLHQFIRTSAPCGLCPLVMSCPIQSPSARLDAHSSTPAKLGASRRLLPAKLGTRSSSVSSHRPLLYRITTTHRVALPHRPLRPTDAIAPLSSPEHAQTFSVSLKHNTGSSGPFSLHLTQEQAEQTHRAAIAVPREIPKIPEPHSTILQLPSPTSSPNTHEPVLSNYEQARSSSDRRRCSPPSRHRTLPWIARVSHLL